jgi:CheY-like chemotaxis protein
VLQSGLSKPTIDSRLPPAFVEPALVRARPVKQSMEQQRGAPARPMARILVVDDDVAAADSLAWLLQSAGHGEARVAYTGTAALALAFKFLPTVALVDLDLPDMSGYEVARQLSQHPQLRALRLIALTADTEHPGRERAREAGVERYLIKPVDAAALAALFAR